VQSERTEAEYLVICCFVSGKVSKPFSLKLSQEQLGDVGGFGWEGDRKLKSSEVFYCGDSFLKKVANGEEQRTCF